jgi:hypothetical protein
MTHPIQPIQKDKDGTARFKANAIVAYLLDKGGIDMNALAMEPFSVEDQEQFAQLIGYSLAGFSELSYVRDETYAAAAQMAVTGESEEHARNAHLREELSVLRAALREPIARLYGIAPEDLAKDG